MCEFLFKDADMNKVAGYIINWIEEGVSNHFPTIPSVQEEQSDILVLDHFKVVYIEEDYEYLSGFKAEPVELLHFVSGLNGLDIKVPMKDNNWYKDIIPALKLLT